VTHRDTDRSKELEGGRERDWGRAKERAEHAGENAANGGQGRVSDYTREVE